MDPSRELFTAVTERDYRRLSMLYAKNAKDSILSFLSLKSRWASSVSSGRSEEKLDDLLEMIADQEKMSIDDSASLSKSPFSRASGGKADEQSYYSLLRELMTFLAERSEEEDDKDDSVQPQKKKKLEISADAERLLRDAAAAFSDSRPPTDFMVFQDGQQSEDPSQLQPIFDGAVANATPAPLGGPGIGASGGAGTILHVACALDVPLALAFLLAMGADARSSHTAFRRLMIHEAACNGSIQCLTLLLELGQKYGDKDLLCEPPKRSITRGTGLDFDLPFLPRRIERVEALAPLHMYVKQARFFGRKLVPEKVEEGRDFLSILRLFREYSTMVEKGMISELDAARKVMEYAFLSEQNQASLARSCGFVTQPPLPRNFMRPFGGTSDGHGNTPLHWAAFKNEVSCVDLLLKYNADPNARAHPSGWTPLHDAAYSNSKETIELLLNAGANVDARANSGATPLCFAAQEDSAEAADLLLQRGADLTTRCAGTPARDDGAAQGGGPQSRFSGYTPLHYACHYNAERAAKVLLAHSSAKKAMDTTDLSERLPIHVAVARGSAEVLRELLHAGVRVETRLQEENARERALVSQQSMSSQSSINAESTPTRRQALRARPSPESVVPRSPSSSETLRSVTPVSSPLLRSMIPAQPIQSSKPWNCLSLRSINECRQLISEAEQSWAPDRHSLFTPNDRKAVRALLLVGKRLELNGSGIYLDLWPQVLTFCGRGWFDPEKEEEEEEVSESVLVKAEENEEDDAFARALASARSDDSMSLSLPTF